MTSFFRVPLQVPKPNSKYNSNLETLARDCMGDVDAWFIMQLMLVVRATCLATKWKLKIKLIKTDENVPRRMCDVVVLLVLLSASRIKQKNKLPYITNTRPEGHFSVRATLNCHQEYVATYSWGWNGVPLPFNTVRKDLGIIHQEGAWLGPIPPIVLG